MFNFQVKLCEETKPFSNVKFSQNQKKSNHVHKGPGRPHCLKSLNTGWNLVRLTSYIWAGIGLQIWFWFLNLGTRSWTFSKNVNFQGAKTFGQTAPLLLWRSGEKMCWRSAGAKPTGFSRPFQIFKQIGILDLVPISWKLKELSEIRCCQNDQNFEGFSNCQNLEINWPYLFILFWKLFCTWLIALWQPPMHIAMLQGLWSHIV